jgi:hypothetical protein
MDAPRHLPFGIVTEWDSKYIAKYTLWDCPFLRRTTMLCSMIIDELIETTKNKS